MQTNKRPELFKRMPAHVAALRDRAKATKRRQDRAEFWERNKPQTPKQP